MADQRENTTNPTGLGISYTDASNPPETQRDAPEGQIEVAHPIDEEFTYFDRDFTDGTEKHAEPLRGIVDNAPANASDIESQPTSAFSPSSSEGGADADDGGAEQDDDVNNSEQAEERYDVDARDDLPPSSGKPIYVPNRVLGTWIREDNDWDLNRANHYYGKVPLHSKTESEIRRYNNRKSAEYRDALRFCGPQPSPLQTASTPDSPLSPENTQSTMVIGILPEPSPGAEDIDALSPPSDHAATPRPESAMGQHRLVALRKWSDEDEDDTSWVAGAIEEVTGSRRGSGESTPEDLPKVGYVDNDTSLAPETPTLQQDRAEHDDDNPDIDGVIDQLISPLSPVSPLDEAEAPSALADRSLPATMANLASNIVGCVAESSTTSSQDVENFRETVPATELFGPRYEMTLAELHAALSPDFDGPETLTRLTPQEGMESWKEWYDRNKAQPQRFRTSRIADTDGQSGDLNLHIDTDRGDAADLLRGQRLLLKQAAPALSKYTERVERVANIELIIGKTDENRVADRESLQEFVKLQMLKYRYQRNEFYDKAREEKNRVGRRNQELAEEREMAKRRNQEIQAAHEGFEALLGQLHITAEENMKLRVLAEQHTKTTQQNADNLQMSSVMTIISQDPVITGEAFRHGSTRRANTGSTSELLDRIEAADLLTRDQQTIIGSLQAENFAWQKYVDESVAALEAERDAAIEEAKSLNDALLEHGWSAFAPSRKQTMRSVNDQGTQTERRTPSVRLQSLLEARPAPLQATRQLQSHLQVARQSPSWADRKEAIMQQPGAAQELESRRAAREKRQALELESLEWFQQRMKVSLEAGKLSYVAGDGR